MSLDRIREDMMVLAGRLVHRSAQTEEERRAAEFIRDRMREYAPDVQVEDFHTIDNYPFLFASYFAEFLVVALLALWFPGFAAVYGAVVFAAFLAEFLGFRLFSRLLPQFESQNVVGRFEALEPRPLIIVTAYYDSGCANVLSQPNMRRWLRPALLLAVLCMLTVIATCAVDAIASYSGGANAFTMHLRWGAVSLLLSSALVLFYAAARGEDIRGANNNASGVAALLRLAEHLEQDWLPHSNVWLAATGSHEAWSSGLRSLLTTHRPPKNNTCVVNLEAVGIGALHYLSAEGMLHGSKPNRRLAEAAQAAAPQYGVAPARLRALPTEAHAAHARGYPALTIMALGEEGLPVEWNWVADRVTGVDEAQIAQAADFTLDLLRRLDESLAHRL